MTILEAIRCVYMLKMFYCWLLLWFGHRKCCIEGIARSENEPIRWPFKCMNFGKLAQFRCILLIDAITHPILVNCAYYAYSFIQKFHWFWFTNRVYLESKLSSSLSVNGCVWGFCSWNQHHTGELVYQISMKYNTRLIYVWLFSSRNNLSCYEWVQERV